MRGRLFSRGPMRVKPTSIGEINVEPTIIVVIEKSQAASFGFNDDPLAIDTAPDIGHIQPGTFCHIDELDRRGCGTRYGRSNDGSIAPFPKRSRQRIEQGAAEHEERRTEEAPTRNIH